MKKEKAYETSAKKKEFFKIFKASCNLWLTEDLKILLKNYMAFLNGGCCERTTFVSKRLIPMTFT